LSDARPARADETDALARVLARAFYDDPVMCWMYPGARGRERKLERFFRIRIRQQLRQGEIWTTPGGEGAAVWAQPGRWELGVIQTLEFAPTYPALGRRIPIALLGLGRIEARHPHEPEHWYLAILGTDPTRQGQGVGSRLLAPVLETCDRDGVPAYLESSKERNVDFYSRFGFRVKEELRLPKGPPLWTMWREPLG
jgi:GNAT superfamily N-acetyltransferase